MTYKAVYIVHFCKNRDCNNAWLDLDLTHAKSRPPRWKYCEDCCKKYGFTNSDIPPKKQLSEKQLETMQKNRFRTRKKTATVEEISKGGKLYSTTA